MTALLCRGGIICCQDGPFCGVPLWGGSLMKCTFMHLIFAVHFSAPGGLLFFSLPSDRRRAKPAYAGLSSDGARKVARPSHHHASGSTVGQHYGDVGLRARGRTNNGPYLFIDHIPVRHVAVRTFTGHARVYEHNHVSPIVFFDRAFLVSPQIFAGSYDLNVQASRVIAAMVTANGSDRPSAIRQRRQVSGSIAPGFGGTRTTMKALSPGGNSSVLASHSRLEGTPPQRN